METFAQSSARNDTWQFLCAYVLSSSIPVYEPCIGAVMSSGTCTNRVGQICFLEIAVANASGRGVGTLMAFQTWASKPSVVIGPRIFKVVAEAVTLLLDVINPNRQSISQYWPWKPLYLHADTTGRRFQNMSVTLPFSTMSFACFGDVLDVVSVHCRVSEFTLNCVSVYFA